MTDATLQRRVHVGGAVPLDAPYIERPADQTLLRCVRERPICHLLAPHWMGKSSLLVRMADRLQREQGQRVITIDLAGIGATHRDSFAWLEGLLSAVALRIHGSLGAFEDWWLARPEETFTSRFSAFFHEQVLSASRSVVVFDEIDVIGLREDAAQLVDGMASVVRAPQVSGLLCFCLAGTRPLDGIVALRSIDVAVVELEDIARTSSNLVALEQYVAQPGISGEALVDEILSCSGGHPFLVMALCDSVARSGGADMIQLFTDEVARSSPLAVHMAQISQALGRCMSEHPERAEGYRRLLLGEPVSDLPFDVQTALLEVGLVRRTTNSELRLRNRLYESYFRAALSATLTSPE